MSQKVLYNWPVLQLLSKDLPAIQQKNIIRELSVNQINCLSEIAINIFYGIIPISENQKELLKPYKKVIIYLSGEHHLIKNKRSYILKNIIGVKHIIKVSNKYIVGLYKEHYGENSEESDPSMGEVHAIDQEG
jgi:hypothetical protein